MNRAELSERHIECRPTSSSALFSPGLKLAQYSSPCRLGQCRSDRLAGGGHHEHIQACDGNLAARFCHRVLGFCVELWIRLLQKLIGGGTRLNVRAVVDEIPDGDARCELGHAAKMIAVPVRGDQIVDLREARILDGGHDAFGISDRARAGVPRIDEHRCAGRRHEERGVAALHVDDIDVQRLGARVERRETP